MGGECLELVGVRRPGAQPFDGGAFRSVDGQSVVVVRLGALRGRCSDGLGVRRRGGRHHDSVDAGRQQLRHRIGGVCTVFGGDGGKHIGPLVGHDEPVDTLQADSVSVWMAPMRTSQITPSAGMAFSDRLGRAVRRRVVLR